MMIPKMLVPPILQTKLEVKRHKEMVRSTKLREL